jgi:hypothetical protein
MPGPAWGLHAMISIRVTNQEYTRRRGTAEPVSAAAPTGASPRENFDAW